MLSPAIHMGSGCPTCSKVPLKCFPTRAVIKPLSSRHNRVLHTMLSPGIEPVIKIGKEALGTCMKPSRGSLQVRHAIFGVGAPEAILVGIVALVVFGPKGLAQAAKTLGQTIRSFQPTLKELAEVSTDLKSTLEQEIGLDEIKSDINSIRNPLPNPKNMVQGSNMPNPGPGVAGEGLGETSGVTGGVESMVAGAIDPDIETKRAESMKAAWGGEMPKTLDSTLESGADVKEEPSVSGKDPLAGLSTAELEEELKRRKDSSNQA